MWKIWEKENEQSFSLGRKSLGFNTDTETRFRLYTTLNEIENDLAEKARQTEESNATIKQLESLKETMRTLKKDLSENVKVN